MCDDGVTGCISIQLSDARNSPRSLGTGASGSPQRSAWVGLAALVFSALYLLSDVIEAANGGFSRGQLWLTLVTEAAIPLFVVGLALAQGDRVGRAGRYGAAVYAYAYVFFTGTVVYALVDNTRDFAALEHDLNPWMTIHGALMVLAGLSLGLATIRAAMLPRWTGAVLMLGVVLVSATRTAPEVVQVLAAGVRDLGFAGMGVALFRGAGVPRLRRASGGSRRLGAV